MLQGLDRGLLNVCAGERRRITVPSDLAYGAEGLHSWSVGIPGGATIVYDLEVLEVAVRGAGVVGRDSALHTEVDAALRAHDEL